YPLTSLISRKTFGVTVCRKSPPSLDSPLPPPSSSSSPPPTILRYSQSPPPPPLPSGLLSLCGRSSDTQTKLSDDSERRWSLFISTILEATSSG
ncbi:hypothetical protein GBAR_LOCUS2790, partial [Geodia barretti]